MAIVYDRVPDAGYETFYNEALRLLETVEEDVRRMVEERRAKLQSIVEQCSHEVAREVPDEIPAEEGEQTDETQSY